MREDRMMNEKKQSAVKRILGTRGMGAVITAFAGLIIIYVAFGLIDRKVFAGQNVMNLLRSMSKYLLIGVGQSYLLITGNIDLSIGSNVDAAKLSGVNVVNTTIKAYLVSAVCACVVGYILCAQAGMGNMEAGNMYEMYGVAAGVIGGISPLGGTGLLLGTFAGAAVWQTLENGLNMIGAQVGIQRLVIGIIVVFSVLLDVVVRSGNFGKKATK